MILPKPPVDALVDRGARAEKGRLGNVWHQERPATAEEDPGHHANDGEYDRSHQGVLGANLVSEVLAHQHRTPILLINIVGSATTTCITALPQQKPVLR